MGTFDPTNHLRLDALQNAGLLSPDQVTVVGDDGRVVQVARPTGSIGDLNAFRNNALATAPLSGTLTGSRESGFNVLSPQTNQPLLPTSATPSRVGGLAGRGTRTGGALGGLSRFPNTDSFAAGNDRNAGLVEPDFRIPPLSSPRSPQPTLRGRPLTSASIVADARDPQTRGGRSGGRTISPFNTGRRTGDVDPTTVTPPPNPLSPTQPRPGIPGLRGDGPSIGSPDPNDLSIAPGSPRERFRQGDRPPPDPSRSGVRDIFFGRGQRGGDALNQRGGQQGGVREPAVPPPGSDDPTTGLPKSPIPGAVDPTAGLEPQDSELLRLFPGRASMIDPFDFTNSPAFNAAADELSKQMQRQFRAAGRGDSSFFQGEFGKAMASLITQQQQLQFENALRSNVIDFDRAFRLGERDFSRAFAEDARQYQRVLNLVNLGFQSAQASALAAGGVSSQIAGILQRAGLAGGDVLNGGGLLAGSFMQGLFNLPLQAAGLFSSLNFGSGGGGAPGGAIGGSFPGAPRQDTPQISLFPGGFGGPVTG